MGYQVLSYFRFLFFISWSTFSLVEGDDADITLFNSSQPQTEDIVEECACLLTPVVKVLHELICAEQVTGAIEDGTVSGVSGQGTVTRLAAGELAAELPRIDGTGAEGTVTAFPHSCHSSLDGLLQIQGLLNLVPGAQGDFAAIVFSTPC